MFLDRQHFEEHWALLKVHEIAQANGSAKKIMVQNFAMEMFDDFEEMNLTERQDVIDMIIEDIEDMPENIYAIN